MRALLVGLALLVPALAQGAQLFVSTEHPFAPDTPGAVVKLEVPAARSVDVRLYRLDDAERYFAVQDDLHHAGSPAAHGEAGRKGEPAPRTPGPLSLVRRALLSATEDGKGALERGLSPLARSLLSAAVQGPSLGEGQALPFLRGLELVERWGLACGTGDEEFSYCDLDLGPRPAGAYLVEAVAGHEVAHAVALFSHLALVARRTEGHAAILAVDGRTGAALPNVHVAVLEPGQPAVHGTTSRQGLFLAKVPPRPSRVFGQLGADVAVLELSPVTAADPERGTLLLTDRGEYRPGERVAFHGFSRSTEERLAPARSERVELSAYDARGSLFHSAEYTLSAQGGFGGELSLPPGLPQGLYRIVATLEGHVAGAEFSVRDAPAPAFTLEAALELPGAGQRAHAALKASAADRPLAEARVSWRAVREAITDEGPGSPEEVERGELSTDAEGQATCDFDTVAGADARYRIEVVARDSAGRVAVAQASATAIRSPLRVSLGFEHRVVAPGSPVQVAVLAREGERPVATDLKLRVQAARSGAAGEGSRDKVLTQDVRTGADGRASLSFTPTSTGYYEVEASRGGSRLSESFLYVTAEGGDIPFSPDALVLVPDKAAYAVGETARILVLAPFDAASALVTVEGADLVRHDALPIRGASAVYQIKVSAQHAPDFTVSAQAIFNERAWRTERVLHVVPRGEPLTLHGQLSIAAAPAPAGTLRLEIDVLDRAGKPVPGAELFAVARDGLSVEAPAPPILAFFHPTRLSDGATASSTGYRSSSSGHRLRPAAFEAVEEGYLPFKGLAQGRPRPHDAGTLLALAATTDAHGKASFNFVAPAGVARVAASIRAVSGAAMGEWSGSMDRGGPTLDLLAPRFMRPGDESSATARATSSAHPLSVELTTEGAVARGTGWAKMPLTAGPKGRTLLARFEGLGSVGQRVAAAADSDTLRRGISGVAGPGRTPLLVPEGATAPVLFVSVSAAAVAASARAAMGEGVEPMTDHRVARLLTRLAEWKARAEPGPELRAAALADVAALAGFAHPEGSFGAYDGAPADLELTSTALLALSLARDEGLEVEEGVLTRGATRLLALKHRGALASLALALIEEAPEGSLETLLASERAGASTVAERGLLALALDAAGEHPAAREVAGRLERSARYVGAVACFAEACPSSETPRSTVRTTAIAMLALGKLSPRAPCLAPAARFLLQQRGAGDFGGDSAGGLAALAIASAPDLLPSKPTKITIESAGKILSSQRVAGEGEVEIDLPGAAALLVAPRGAVVWRLAWSAAPTEGTIKIVRTFEPLDAEAEGIHPGDRVRVSLHLEADAKIGPVRIEDPYPAGLSPVEQEGEHEPFRMLDESAQRLFAADRMIFLLPSLKAGATDLVWEATARVPGKFTAAPAIVVAGAQSGRSEASTLTIEEAGQ